MAKEKTLYASKATARYLRVSPQKVRYVIDLVRGERVPKAYTILASINKKATKYIQKTLHSAVSNAMKIPTVKTEELFISKITADKGPMLKRYRAAAMGRATMIRHRTTHIFIELSRIMKEEPKTSSKKTLKRKR